MTRLITITIDRDDAGYILTATQPAKIASVRYRNPRDTADQLAETVSKFVSELDLPKVAT